MAKATDRSDKPGAPGGVRLTVAAGDEAVRASAKTELEERLAERDDAARDEALVQLARTNAELEHRLAERTIERDDVARDEALAELARTNAELEHRLAERTIERDDVARDEALAELARTNRELEQRLAERTIERDDVARDDALAELARTNKELKQRLAERTIERDDVARDDALAELARTNAELKAALAERTIERDDVARDDALAELARTNAELKQRLAERTIERDDVARDEALAELARTNAELEQRLAERTIERDDVARDDALAELARTNAELKQRLAERTIERDDVARDDALAELARTNAELKAALAERTIERDDVARDDALAELARTNAELKQRLAERTIERDDIARDEALAELARTNAELKQRLAERTIERDDIARDEALAELARTNAELKQRLAERTIERDDVARDEALTELGRTNAELKQRLAERTIERDDVAKHTATAELARTNKAEEQLRLHAAELEAVNAELESFSYTVSHDLRAPVRAVLGYASAIDQDCGEQLGPEGRRLLAVITTEASRMGDLIDDLLAFSRLGRQPILNAVVNMTALAREAVASGSPADGANVVFTIPELPAVRGDRTLLRQVWVNLISNAVKYAGKKTAPEVGVWATTDGATTWYHVRDNGVGFDMRYANKLFGVFQRLHRADEFPGTGVGLQSSCGSFNATAAPCAPTHGWAKVQRSRLPFQRRHGMTGFDDIEILLVEDNQSDAEMTVRALKRRNVLNRLHWVKDGVEALDFIRCTGEYADRDPHNTLKLVLLDLKMPRLDGLDVLRALKGDVATQRLPIIVMTSSNQDRDIAECYRLGVNSYVTKPVQFTSFSEAVADIGVYWLMVNQAPGQ